MSGIFRDTELDGPSGGIIMMGCHMLQTWSTTRSVIAMSLGEAEYYAIVRMGSQLLGTEAMLAESGTNVNLNILLFVSVAHGITARRGLGGVPHIEVSTLWLQDRVNKRKIQFEKSRELRLWQIRERNTPSKQTTECSRRK